VEVHPNHETDRPIAAGKVSCADRTRYRFVVHGNRCIAYIVFQRLPPTLLAGHSSLPADIGTQVAAIVDETFGQFRTKSDLLYPQAYLAQLFKNQKKLSEILSAMNS